MNRNKGAKKRRETIRVWDYAEALKAVPYLASVMRTVREYRIEALRQHREAKQLANAPGRPNRQTLIAQDEAAREARLANDRFHQALEELHAMGVFCLDPVRGEALVPFAHADQLAWFIYDLFDEEPFRFWRYHTDPLEKRRATLDILRELRGESVVV